MGLDSPGINTSSASNATQPSWISWCPALSSLSLQVVLY